MRAHPDLEAAARARVLSARLPGEQYISEAAARRPRRAARPRAAPTATRGAGSGASATGYVYHHDRLLSAPSPHYFDEAQVLGLLGAIEAPTLLVQAADGWPLTEPGFSTRCDAVKGPLVVARTRGSHFAHIDDDSFPEVAAAVVPFMARGWGARE